MPASVAQDAPGRLQIIEGKIAASTPYQRLVRPIPSAPHLERVRVFDFNEKKTDVNLACDLLAGAWTGAYEQAVICSNDTDLEAALATVRRYHPDIRLGVVAPIPNIDHPFIAADLKRHAHWSKILSLSHIERSQLPERIPASALRRPDAWKQAPRLLYLQAQQIDHHLRHAAQQTGAGCQWCTSMRRAEEQHADVLKRNQRESRHRRTDLEIAGPSET